MPKNQPSLPAKRAFVVQVHADAQVEHGHFKGRVEHLVSGEASHFESLEELAAFIFSSSQALPGNIVLPGLCFLWQTRRWRTVAMSVSFVTGASSGIGRSLARRLALRGEAIAAVARRKPLLDTLVEEITCAGGRAVAIGCDVTDRAGVLAAVEEAEALLGPIDRLVAFGAEFVAELLTLPHKAGEDAHTRQDKHGGSLSP